MLHEGAVNLFQLILQRLEELPVHLILAEDVAFLVGPLQLPQDILQHLIVDVIIFPPRVLVLLQVLAELHAGALVARSAETRFETTQV